MNSINISTNVILKYVLYLFPIFIIIGNAAINSAMLIVFLIYFLRCFNQKKIIFTETYEFKFFLYFYLYLLINSFLSEDIKSSLIRTVPYIKFFIFVLIYKNFIEEKKIDLKNLGLFWLIVITILSLDIIYQSFFGFNIFNFSTAHTSRNSGLFFEELVAGGFLLSFVFITIFLITKKTNYLYLYLYFTFCLVVIFLTSAAIFFSFVSGIIFLFLGIYFLRLSGQGLMAHTASVAISRYFDKSRGKALSYAWIGMSFGEFLLPMIMVYFLTFIYWRNIWLTIAVVIILFSIYFSMD